MFMIKTNQPNQDDKVDSLASWQASLYSYVLGDTIRMGLTTAFAMSQGISLSRHSQRALLDDLWEMVEEVPLDKLSCNELDVRLKQEWDSLQAKKRKLARQSTRGWGKNRGFDGYHNGK